MAKKIYILLILILVSTLNVLANEDSSYGERILTDSYEISRSKVERTMSKGHIFQDQIEILNKRPGPIDVTFIASQEISDLITFDASGININPSNSSIIYFDIRAIEVGNFEGTITLSGGLNSEIPVNITVVDESLNPLFMIKTVLLKDQISLNKPLQFKINVDKLIPQPLENVTFEYILHSRENETINLGEETISLESSLSMLKNFKLPEMSEGYYILDVLVTHNNKTIQSTSEFRAVIPLMQRKLFGIFPVWLLMILTTLIILGIIAFILIRRHIQSKKRYKMTLDMKTLPKKDKEFLWLGKIAERKEFAYFDPARFTTHTIVAGATGGGKSIASQVIIEEALKQNISVIVFDPTAQWSGMLRKCTDKKMFEFYPPFGLKPQDARGFPGNIRAVKDARQIIDVNKYIEPGHIQIFTLNKLQPKDMDIFVANIIREIFRKDPHESPVLKTLLVFDEVHRLLPKFGGSGEGFLQIERGCREFRKWGLGIMLISQVLNDFMGEIKANISTEIQMRTRDEGDLNRINTKYGEEFLQSLVKASVGAGMVVNPAYNHANPYFIQFRPILHNTRRLTDEELDKYNEYNDMVDDLEYQIQQLEELKVDTFDLKMELKLVKDKIMVGNFSVVDIYLEGLKPRIAKNWDKLGKKPKKLEIKLADLDEIKKSVEEAKKAKEKALAQEKKTEAKTKEAKKDPLAEIENKQVKPLIFDNGVMVSSLKELKDYLPNLDADIFKIHVNEEKNDISKWFEQLDKTFAARISSLKEKEEMSKQIMEYKPSSEEKAEEEKPEEKSTEEKPSKENPAEEPKPKPGSPEKKLSEKPNPKPTESKPTEPKPKPKEKPQPAKEEKPSEKPKEEPKKE